MPRPLITPDQAPALGTFIMVPSPEVVRLVGELATAGLDFVVIDAQHQAFGPETLGNVMHAADAAGVACLVRVPVRDYSFAELALDLGAAGVVFPVIDTPDDALRAVAACRYPPDGTRSVGGLRHRAGGPDPLCIVQIERYQAVARAEEILSVGGVDAVFPGPVDLAASKGIEVSYEHFADAAAQVQDLVDEIERAAIEVGVARMRHGESSEAVTKAVEDKCEMVTVSSDASLLVSGLRRLLAGIRA